MPSIPSGTVTFVFTDIEGSTRLLKQLGDRYADLLAEHRTLLRSTFDAHGGHEIDTQGDAFFYSFSRAREAVAAAVDAQRAFAEHDWPGGASVRVRMGLHTGEPLVGEEGYTGLDVVRAARIAGAGRGGQILLSDATRALVGSNLPPGVAVHDLGTQRLKDLDEPEPVYELVLQPSAVPGTLVPQRGGPLRPPAAPSEPGGRSRWLDFAERTRDTLEAHLVAEFQRALDAELGAHGMPEGGEAPPSPASLGETDVMLRRIVSEMQAAFGAPEGDADDEAAEGAEPPTPPDRERS